MTPMKSFVTMFLGCRTKGVPDLASADKLTVIAENLEILEFFFFYASDSCKTFQFLSFWHCR